MSDLFPILKEFEGVRKQDNIYPVCTPLLQLRSRFPSDQQEWLSMEIKRLKKEGKIRVWNAINDLMIQII